MNLKLQEVQEWKDGEMTAEFGSTDIKKGEMLSMRVEISKKLFAKEQQKEVEKQQEERAQNFSCIDDPVEEEQKVKSTAESGFSEFKPTKQKTRAEKMALMSRIKPSGNMMLAEEENQLPQIDSSTKP